MLVRSWDEFLLVSEVVDETKKKYEADRSEGRNCDACCASLDRDLYLCVANCDQKCFLRAAKCVR